MGERTTLTIGLVQRRAAAGRASNLARAIEGIEEARRRGAEVVCLQELFLGPYFCVTEDEAAFALAEAVPGPTTEALAEVARRLEVVLVAPLFERRARGLFHNSAAVIDADGSFLGSYRKAHIPDDPGYYEKFYFTPGDTGFRAFDTRYGRIGVLICWDQWFPEAARLTALRGADVLFYPTAIGWHRSQSAKENAAQHDAWEVSMRAHAIHNGVFVAAVNRCGEEGETRFWGQSFVADVFGRVLERADVEDEAVLVQRLDLGRIEEVRCQWPFLRDRRIDAYQGLTSRFLGGGHLT